MRLEGGCTTVIDPGVNIDPSTFDEHCDSLPEGTRQSIAARGFTMGMMGCTNISFSGFASGNSTTHPDIRYFYYKSGAGDFPSGQGLIECHATVSTGYAFLRGALYMPLGMVYSVLRYLLAITIVKREYKDSESVRKTIPLNYRSTIWTF